MMKHVLVTVVALGMLAVPSVAPAQATNTRWAARRRIPVARMRIAALPPMEP